MAKRISILRTNLSLVLATAALSTLALSGAGAQSLLDPAPAATPAEARPMPAASDVILSTRAPEPEQTAAEPATLVPFEQSAPAFHLTGEDDVARFTFALGADQAAAGGALDLTYRSAVSVLPDTSSLAVTVNGHDAGSFSVASPNGFTLRTVNVAASMLKPGRNVVEIRARQFHRVDCSLDATYELWTELDPSASGFRAEKGRGFTAADDLLAVARGKDGATDIRLILPQTATADMLNDALPTLQTLALFLNRDDIAVTMGDTPGTGPGIDLTVSTDKTRVRPADAGGAVSPYGLSIADGATPGRAAVSLRGATRADLETILLQSVGGLMKDGLDSGILSTRPGTIDAEASKTFTLADAGYESRVFTGRLSRTRFDLAMPADFYPGDYGTIDLKLHAATSPGLAYTSQLLVRVNDRVVTSYPFRNVEGEQFTGKLIELPLRAFRPGQNKVELLAELPVAADAACAPEARDDTRPRFILLKETEIGIPPLARIGRLPDLGALAGTGYPYSDGKPFDIVVQRPDGQTAGAALTMLSRLSVAARKPLAAEIRFGAPDPTSKKNALILSTTAALADLGPSGKAGPSFASAPDAGLPQIDRIETSAVTPAFAARSDDSGALLDAFRKSTTRPDDPQSWVSQASGWISAASLRFNKWLNYQSGADIDTLSKGNVLLSVSQMPAPESDAVWTVLQAQSPGDTAAGTLRLVDPSVWSQLSGGSATIEVASLAVNTAPATSHFVAEVTDKSPSNLRRLTAAWFSDNFQFYVALVVVLMGVFAVWLGRTVPRKGVRSDQ